jgi:tetratricopeptide (TPR) repeat protein
MIMRILKFIVIFLWVGIYSCKQKAESHKIGPTAIRLSNTAMALVPFIKNTDSSEKAILLLDSATEIDNNYFLGYQNKLMFLNELKQYCKAIIAINNLIRIKPIAQDLYFNGGLLYEKTGDTVSSKNYFQKSLTICNNVLDTMTASDRDYEMLNSYKAVNLIMLGEQAKANKLLNNLYDNQTDTSLKKSILLLMNKNKQEFIEAYN